MRYQMIAAVWLLCIGLASACGYEAPDDVAGIGDAPPRVVFTEPAEFAAQVDTETVIRVRFSVPVDMQSATVSVEGAGLPVDGEVLAIDAETMAFVARFPLSKGMPYEMRIERVADLAGNLMLEPYSLQFTTLAQTCVKPAGGDGCFALISTAVSAAMPGDGIAVAAGTYNDSIIVDKTVNLLGGYDSSFSTRDPKSNLTTITAAPSDYALIEILTRNGEPTNSTIIDGFTITGHRRVIDHGGGIRATRSNPRIRNNVISSNQALFLGGGIYVELGSVHLARNRIESNSLFDTGSGAGIAIEGSAELLNNDITDNFIPQDGSGGGVSIFGSAVLINNRINGNRVAGTAYSGLGGGIHGRESVILIQGGTISRNQVSGGGGVSVGAGAGAYFVSNSNVTIESVTVSDNVGSTDLNAGASGLHFLMSKFVVSSSVITSNRGGTGGIVVGNNNAHDGAIVNCTINSNDTRGVWASDVSLFSITNSLIAREPVGVMASNSAVVKFRSNAFFGTTSNVTGVLLDSTNITVDPRITVDLRLMKDSPLIDAGQPGAAQTAQGAIVQTSQFDIEGDPRNLAGSPGNSALPDIGADEYRPMP